MNRRRCPSALRFWGGRVPRTEPERRTGPEGALRLSALSPRPPLSTPPPSPSPLLRGPEEAAHGEARTGCRAQVRAGAARRAQGAGCGEGTRPSPQRLRQAGLGRRSLFTPARRLRRAGCRFRWSRDPRGRVESCGARREGRAGKRRRDVERGGRGRSARTEPGCVRPARGQPGPTGQEPLDLPSSLNNESRTGVTRAAPSRVPTEGARRVHWALVVPRCRPRTLSPDPAGSGGGGSRAPRSADPAGPGWRLSTDSQPHARPAGHRGCGRSRAWVGAVRREAQGLPADTGFPQRSASNPPPAGATIRGRVGRSGTVCRESPAASRSRSMSQIPGGNRGGWAGGVGGSRPSGRSPAFLQASLGSPSLLSRA